MPWGQETDPKVVRISVFPEHRILTRATIRGVKPAPHTAPSTNDKPDDTKPPAPPSSWSLD